MTSVSEVGTTSSVRMVCVRVPTVKHTLLYFDVKAVERWMVSSALAGFSSMRTGVVAPAATVNDAAWPVASTDEPS